MVIQKVWPEKHSQCLAAVKPYWSVRSELSIAEGFLLCGSSLIVPMSLRRETMDGIHDGHFSETKSLIREKSSEKHGGQFFDLPLPFWSPRHFCWTVIYM
jgi:hypothetical protein